MKIIKAKRGKDSDVIGWLNGMHRLAVGERVAAGIDHRVAHNRALLKGPYRNAVLSRCFYEDYDPQANEKMPPPYLNLLAMFVSNFIDAMLDQRLSFQNKWWTVSPTPMQEPPYTILRELAADIYDSNEGRLQDAFQRLGIDPEGAKAEHARERLYGAYVKPTYDVLKNMAAQGVSLQDMEIFDLLTQAKLPDKVEQFIRRMAVDPYAVVKGPYPTWRDAARATEQSYEYGEETSLGFEVIDPRMFAISPDGHDIDDATAVFEIMRFKAEDLLRMKRDDAYNTSAIDKLMPLLTKDNELSTMAKHFCEAFPAGTYIQTQSFRDGLINSNSVAGVLITGRWTGEELYQRGFSISKKDRQRVLQAQFLVIDGYIVFSAIDLYPKKRKPYSIGAYRMGDNYRDHSSIVDLGADPQRFAQNIFQDISTASWQSSEGMMEVDEERMAGEVDINQLRPGSRYTVRSDGTTNNAPAVRYVNAGNSPFVPQQVLERFINLMARIIGLDENLTGASAVSSVNRVGGVAEQARAAALTKIQSVRWNVDKAFGKPIEMTFHFLNQYSNKTIYKWEAEVSVTGSESIRSEAQMRQDAQLLLQTVTVARRSGMIDQVAYDLYFNRFMRLYGVDPLGTVPDPSNELEVQRAFDLVLAKIADDRQQALLRQAQAVPVTEAPAQIGGAQEFSGTSQPLNTGAGVSGFGAL